MDGLAVYMKETCLYTGYIPRKLGILVYVFDWLILIWCLLFLYKSPSLSLCMVFDAISSNIDEVLLGDLYVNVFVFADFNVNHKDWVTYSSGTDRLDEIYYNLTRPYLDG